MKRTGLLVAFILILCSPVKAQFGDYGIKLGVGIATLSDDLSTKSPTLGFNIGGYIDYTFLNKETAFGEIFYLQTGINLIHRGSHFEEVLQKDNTMSIRTGYYDAWYAQIPILACMHFELPVRAEGHIIGAYIGPGISYGLFGHYGDRKITPGIASPSANYDVNFNGAPADRQVFNHINRLDISALAGITYEYGNLNIALGIDYGFIATSSGEDILRIIETNQNGGTTSDINVKIPNGYNLAILASITYKIGTFLK